MSAVSPFIVYAMPAPDSARQMRPVNPMRDERMSEAFERKASEGELAVIMQGGKYLGRVLARDEVHAKEEAMQCWPREPRFYIESVERGASP